MCHCNLKSKERWISALEYLSCKPEMTGKDRYLLIKRCKNDRKCIIIYLVYLLRPWNSVGLIFKGSFKEKKWWKWTESLLNFHLFRLCPWFAFSFEWSRFPYVTATLYMPSSTGGSNKCNIWITETCYFLACSPWIYGTILTTALKITALQLFL